jgi:subtilisin family serine protease
MTTADPGTSGQDNHISAIQVEYIFEEFGEEAGTLATQPPNWLKTSRVAPIEFIYQRDHLLTTDPGQLVTVLRTLGIEVDTKGGVTEAAEGLWLVQLPPGRDVPRLLVEVQKTFTPRDDVGLHYLMTIQPATYCPATEPMLPAQPVQDPAVSPAPGCDGINVKVAVVDTGFAHVPPKPWMIGVTGPAEPVLSGGFIRRYAGHGLFVASTIRGIAREAAVKVWQVFDKAGTNFETDVVNTLDEVLAWQPDVISLSAGTHTLNDQGLLSFKVFVAKMTAQLPGTVLVAAAGNDGRDWKFSPASLAIPHPHRVVSVGALSPNSKQVATFSDRGRWVSVYARGRNLVQAYVNGTYRYHETQRNNATFTNGLARWSGTSFSTPLVSGLIAARLSSLRLTTSQPVAARQAWAELQQIAATQALQIPDNNQMIPAPRLFPDQACAPLPPSPAPGS